MYTLKHLCSQAMQEISKQLAFSLSKEDISWVIAVPAIWNDAAKQFMREAAIEVRGPSLLSKCSPSRALSLLWSPKTGLVCPEQLYLALEPEVASLYCRHLYGEQLNRSDSSQRSICRIGEGKTTNEIGPYTLTKSLFDRHQLCHHWCRRWEYWRKWECLIVESTTWISLNGGTPIQ